MYGMRRCVQSRCRCGREKPSPCADESRGFGQPWTDEGWGGPGRSWGEVRRGEPSAGADMVGGEPSPGADLGIGGRGYQRKRSVLKHCRHPHVTRVHRWRSLLQPTASGAAFSPVADAGGMSQALVQMRAGVCPVPVQMVTKRDWGEPIPNPGAREGEVEQSRCSACYSQAFHDYWPQ